MITITMSLTFFTSQARGAHDILRHNGDNMASFYPHMKTLTMELIGILQPLANILTQASTHITTYYAPIDAAYSEYIIRGPQLFFKYFYFLFGPGLF